MIKYIIKITYDGSKYEGLQKLKKGNTVQGELEEVLTKLEKSQVKLKSSGRTDKGVHALEQVCSFELEREITPYKLKGYLNRETSPYLYVRSCECTDDENFHPRFSVISKTYKYIINTGEYNPIKKDYVYNYNKPLNINLMIEASLVFLGPHNFKAFVIGKHTSYDSIIQDIEIKEEKEDIIIRISGAAFYTYMVRNIVSTLILVGENTLTKKDIEKMLLTGKKVIEYSPAPPGGLYLESVSYNKP